MLNWMLDGFDEWCRELQRINPLRHQIPQIIEVVEKVSVYAILITMLQPY